MKRSPKPGLLKKLLGSCVALADESAVLIRNIFNNGDLGVIDKGGLKNYQTEGDRAVQDWFQINSRTLMILRIGDWPTNFLKRSERLNRRDLTSGFFERSERLWNRY